MTAPSASCSTTSECGADEACVSGICQAATTGIGMVGGTGTTGMTTPTCSDGVQNGTELAVDCGGSCAACAPTCTDSAMNGSETGIDCGGTCDACAPGCDDGAQNGNESGVDCGGTCAACPTCTDGAMNGSETGLDCGGSCNACPTCTDGTMNGDETGVDCGGGCTACPTCTDSTQNGSETDVDCGGGCPNDCGPGGGCSTDSDCTGGACDIGGSETCLPTCFDLAHNGDETDIDCGGSCARDCDTGGGCDNDGDCASGNCGTTTCVAPTCSDGEHNGLETDVDCGGAQCVLENKPCAPQGGCTINADCAGNSCVGFTCAPTCSDGVLNQNESAVDCGGVCVSSGSACGVGETCNLAGDCATNVCAGTCQGAPTCGNGTLDAGETGTDCGGGGCPDCGTGGGCTDGDNCQSGVCGLGTSPTGDNCVSASCQCQVATCFDNVPNGTETGLDCGGPSCGDCGVGQGCAGPADCATGICTTNVCADPTCDGNLTPGEVCDGTNLNGQTCLTQNFLGGGTLACAADCGSFDTSNCNAVATCAPACGDAQTCVLGECVCGQGQLACATECVDPSTNGSHCGACNNVCNTGANAGKPFCTSGGCVATCPAPLVGFNGSCVDRNSSNDYCGSPAVACTGGTVCNNGECQAPAAVLTKPAKCVGSGPPIVLPVGVGTGGSLDCLGNLAANTFRWGVCACDDISITQPFEADSFDSNVGPYHPGSFNCTGDGLARSCAPTPIGGGVAANGAVVFGQTAKIFGQVSAANISTPQSSAVDGGGLLEVADRLMCGGNFRAKADSYVVGDVFAEGSLTRVGGGDLTLLRDLYAQSAGDALVKGTLRPAPANVPAPCDCNQNQLLDLVGLINQRALTANNDNELAGLNPDLFKNGANVGPTGGGRIDLDCGIYYLSEITETSVTINVRGNVAIFVGGQINTGTGINFALAPTAQLDLFVLGSVCTTQNAQFGSVNYPARSRVYIAAGQPTAPSLLCGTINGLRITQSGFLAGNFYLPYGEVRVPQEIDLYGGVFAKTVNATQDWRVHFDRAITEQGVICSACGDGTIGAGEQCEGTNTLGRTCQQFGFDGGTLACNAGTCQLDTSGCFRCGDGTKNGAEQCDGSDLGNPAPTCEALGYMGGTVTCVDCQLSTVSCSNAQEHYCGDGFIDPGEQCDGANLNGNNSSCAAYEGYNGGNVTCVACALNFGSCSYCGDGVRNGGETCDGGDLGASPPTCDDILGGSGYSGFVVCDGFCEFSGENCSTQAQCESCGDCSGNPCVEGACGSCGSDFDCCSGLYCHSDGNCYSDPENGQ